MEQLLFDFEEKSVNTLVKELKENNEDFEWYPTTQDIVDCLVDHISEKESYGEKEYKTPYNSILDIGCGNGSFFKKFDNTKQVKYNSTLKYASKKLIYQRYGIEKSYILYEQLPDEIVLLGSDFNEQTLIDKQVGLIFCNPPYSEYEQWTEKIIMQGNCDAIALVIPERWKNNERIAYALKKRNMKAEILGSFDFENADRKARAKVELLFITFDKKGYASNLNRYYYETEVKTDPFDIWFEETFKINAEKEEKPEYEKTQQKKDELIEKGDTAEMLVKFYNADMEKLYNNYRALEKLDPAIFRELKVDVKGLKESLKSRINGLKHIYWDMLFKKYNRITKRLTSSGRRKVIEKLNNNTAIDFTINNIYQLTMWLIKNSNKMFDEQISEFFLELCNAENIHRYKSNLRWNEDDWRYIKQGFDGWNRDVVEHKKKLKNVMLDYRIVVKAYSNFSFSEYSRRVEMKDDCLDFLEDMYVIAENLGFKVDKLLPISKYDVDYEAWKDFNVYYFVDSKEVLFANVKLYKNGNRHIKFCKEFMQKLNVEMARINGWIHDKSEVIKEMEISEKEINKIWQSNYKILPQSEVKILGLPDIV